MVSDSPEPIVDQLLDRYIAAWHAGESPSADAFVATAPADVRQELGALIAGFLELAPTILSSDAVAEAKVVDPLVARITALEADRWETHAVAGGAQTAAADDSHDVAAHESQAPDSGAEPTWGERLRSLREGSGVSLAQLAGAFARRFGLDDADQGRAATVFAELEAGTVPATGVAARAARAIEELLGVARGALDGGGAIPIGGALMRGELPESADERRQLADLLRSVDDALPPADGATETLSDLLGA